MHVAFIPLALGPAESNHIMLICVSISSLNTQSFAQDGP